MPDSFRPMTPSPAVWVRHAGCKAKEQKLVVTVLAMSHLGDKFMIAPTDKPPRAVEAGELFFLNLFDPETVAKIQPPPGPPIIGGGR